MIYAKNENSHLNLYYLTFAPQIKKKGKTNGSFQQALLKAILNSQRSRLPQCRYPRVSSAPIRRYSRETSSFLTSDHIKRVKVFAIFAVVSVPVSTKATTKKLVAGSS